MPDAITLFPTPLPSRNVPSTWSALFETNFLDCLNPFITELNTFASSLNTFSTYSTSATSLAIGTGTKSLTVDTGKSYQPGNPVIIACTTTPTNWMYGTVTSYTSGTGALVVQVDLINGSGNYTAWTVTLCGPAYNSQYIYRDARTSNTILGTADRAKFIDVTSGTFSQTYESASTTLGDGWYCFYRNSGTGIVTHDPDGSEQIDGATTLLQYPGETRLIVCNGTAFYTVLIGGDETNHEVTVHTGNGYGSTNNKIRRYTTALVNTGTAITYADSAENGATFTINTPGVYSLAVQDIDSDANGICGISKNSTELTTAITSIAVSNQLAYAMVAHYSGTVSVVCRLSAGDVIRSHGNGTCDGTNNLVSFSIKKVK